MGNEYITVRHLQIYKIDFEKSLIYIKGSVPGPSKRLINISDSFYHWSDNINKLNYPTFIYEKDKIYANQVIMEPS